MENDKGDGNVARVSTRQWAAACDYNVEKVFNKLYHDDINYLRDMSDLWEKRRAPESIRFSAEDLKGWVDPTGMRDQRLWDLTECMKVFEDSVNTLKER